MPSSRFVRLTTDQRAVLSGMPGAARDPVDVGRYATRLPYRRALLALEAKGLVTLREETFALWARRTCAGDHRFSKDTHA
jgi:hypothetical protein